MASFEHSRQDQDEVGCWQWLSGIWVVSPLSAASARPTQPFTWVYTLISSIMGTLGFVILAYFLVTNGRIGSW